MLSIKVKRGKNIYDWSAARLKSDLAYIPQLSTGSIDRIVENVEEELQRMRQPVSTWDIALTTHYTMKKMGYDAQADAYMQSIKNRHDNSFGQKHRIQVNKIQRNFKKSHKKRNIAILFSTVLLFLFVIFPLAGDLNIIPTTVGSSSPSPEQNWLLNPIIVHGQANVTYPPDYGVLANYTLALINHDRETYGLRPVTLSPIPSAQQHADSMMYFGYFSHWDTQGYKPYMRYTLLGGTGAVSENVALGYCIYASEMHSNSSAVVPAPCSLRTIENALNNSEWEMMYNDQASNNGHRDNILDPLHNQVSIGIAYNRKTSAVFLVEDFINSYINWSKITFSNGVITMEGRTSYSGFDISSAEIMVFYDLLPKPIPVGNTQNTLESLSAINSPQPPSFTPILPIGFIPRNQLNQYLNQVSYWGAYGQGVPMGAAFPPCPAGFICGNTTLEGYMATYAQVWQLNGKNIEIQFSLQPYINAYGPGVYTIYLYPSSQSNDPLTSISFFINGT